MNENKPHNADAIDDKEARYKARMQRKKRLLMNPLPVLTKIKASA